MSMRVMKGRAAFDLAIGLSRAVISASNKKGRHCSWGPQVEETLHRLGWRQCLTPSLVANVIDPFLLTHHSLALGFFNWASQQPGFTHTTFTFHSLLKSLSHTNHFTVIHSLLKQAKALNFPIHPSLLSSIIASHVACNRAHEAFSLFSGIAPLCAEIGGATCNSLLAALASDGYLESAHKVFDEMIGRGVGFSTLGFGVFVWRVCREGDLEKVLSLLDEVRECGSGINGSVVAVLIVHGLCCACKVSEALWMLDELRSRGWKPDFIAYWVVAAAFRSMGNVADEVKVLKMKRKLGVSPRCNDYRDLILGLVSERRICEAREVGEVIVGGNFPVEDDVLNALIGSVSSVDPGAAIVFFKFMVQKERFPTVLTISNLSRNLCRHGKVDELAEVFHVLNSENYFKDVEGYNVMVSFLCKAGRVREGYAALQEMKKQGFRPNVSSYNYIMEACCKEDLLRPAKKLWDEMFSSGCCGNLKTYNILIQKFSEVGQAEEAQMLFYHMLDKGLEPDVTSYTFLLEGLCQENKLEAAFELYNKSVKQNIILARNILSSFVSSLCRKGHLTSASKLLCSLNHDIGHAESHVILLKCLADAQEIPIAIEHLKWVQEKSPSMLQDICTGLLASLSSATCPEPMLEFLQRIQDVFDFPYFEDYVPLMTNRCEGYQIWVSLAGCIWEMEQNSLEQIIHLLPPVKCDSQ
ncbi:pentatricopeptide repeat-containing protein At5g14080 isoform X1 [Cajanus cajan]|uniref:pentatricopeptide repeat-containing protein At5g14080 isoform X1 n=1 Tax=Cajanus cajan TaxID=3821 RepID=UPI0010FAF04B|nr:pentatricopeptide repeat-containing protein At5g14080 isoform X1 [Cajanus cajan]XP_029131027.1 pentatricopeptide repeat-containing protein At5g14080 isoform X1 [Cajanus cajan]